MIDPLIRSFMYLCCPHLCRDAITKAPLQKKIKIRKEEEALLKVLYADAPTAGYRDPGSLLMHPSDAEREEDASEPRGGSRTSYRSSMRSFHTYFSKDSFNAGTSSFNERRSTSGNFRQSFNAADEKGKQKEAEEGEAEREGGGGGGGVLSLDECVVGNRVRHMQRGDGVIVHVEESSVNFANPRVHIQFEASGDTHRYDAVSLSSGKIVHGHRNLDVHADHLRKRCGVRVDWLLAFCFDLDLWDWPTWQVRSRFCFLHRGRGREEECVFCMFSFFGVMLLVWLGMQVVMYVIKPITEVRDRCRFVEAKEVRAYAGEATV